MLGEFDYYACSKRLYSYSLLFTALLVDPTAFLLYIYLMYVIMAALPVLILYVA
jgi:hypothetical protein